MPKFINKSYLKKEFQHNKKIKRATARFDENIFKYKSTKRDAIAWYNADLFGHADAWHWFPG